MELWFYKELGGSSSFTKTNSSTKNNDAIKLALTKWQIMKNLWFLLVPFGSQTAIMWLAGNVWTCIMMQSSSQFTIVNRTICCEASGSDVTNSRGHWSKKICSTKRLLVWNFAIDKEKNKCMCKVRHCEQVLLHWPR